MAVIGSGISLRGMTHEKFHYPFYLKDGITRADVGKAVSLDPTGSTQVELAADDAQVIGELVTVEDRSVEGVLVGTVALRGGFKFAEVDTPANALAVGDTVVGAGVGTVKARMNAAGDAKEADHSDNIVVAVNSGQITIVR